MTSMFFGLCFSMLFVGMFLESLFDLSKSRNSKSFVKTFALGFMTTITTSAFITVYF